MIRDRLVAIRCLPILIGVALPSAGPSSTLRASSQVDGLLAAGRYEQAERAARADVENLRTASSSTSPEVARALDVLVRALVLNGRGAHADTLALARQLLQTKEAFLGNHDPGLVPTLLNLSDVLIASAEFDPAIAYAKRAVALCERSPGVGGIDLAEALDHLGSALSSARRDGEALDALNRSLSLKEKALDTGDERLARTVEEIGLVLQRKGEYGQAGAYLRRAAGIQEEANVGHPAYARTLNLIAQQLWFEGQLSESRNASERALAIAERTLRSDHPTIALSLRYLAATLADLGDLRRSASLKERALAISERNFGLNHHVTGEYVHALGLAELDLGDYQAARQHFQRALGIFEARYGPWHEYVATTLSVLALADASLGDYASARREQSRAVAIHARVGGPNHPFVATALTELATVYRDQGLWFRALPLLERALAIREKSFKPDHRDVARTLADLSATLIQVNRSVQAQSQAVRALRIWERLDAPEAPEYATVLVLYAELQANRGDYAAAKSHFEKALQIRAKALGVSHPSYAEAESGLGVALARLGQMEPALQAAIEAEATGREHLRLMLRSLPEREALNYAASRPRALNLILSMSTSRPEAAPAAFEGVIRSRALVLDEIATRQSAGTAVQGDPLRVRLASAQQRLANLLVRGPGQLSWAQYGAVVDATRRESEQAEQAFAERSAEFRAERSRALIGLEQVRASLSTQHALVSFVRYDRLVLGGTKRGASAQHSRAPRSIPSYVALVLRPPGDPVAVPLGSAASVDTLVAEWRQGIVAEVAGGTSGAVRPSRVSGAALRRLVWDPIANQLQGVDRVFIVPDGSLGLVPFAALPVGARSYLLEIGPVLHYLTAERDVVPSPRSPAATGGLLAVGGPAFDNSTADGTKNPARASTPPAVTALVRGNAVCGSLQTIRFDPLVGALQEVNELSRIWTAHTDGAADVGATRLLTGRAAGETAFKREAPHHRVLHLATHGFFLGGGCSPAIGTRGVGGLSTVRRARTRIENPLLLSGLAFSGANRRASATPDEDDGILTAEEVASLDLQGTEWAVLSACDTGLGEIKAGEGVFGLRRAFQIAGVRTVIMSLWSVDDQATRLWMRALYDGRLNRHLTTAEAVREASLTVLRDRRARGLSTHPFFWAAFVAAGDWR